MSRTYTGIVVRASHDMQTPTVTIMLDGSNPPQAGRDHQITMHCGTRVAVEACAMIGRKVQFQAELSERTQCLTNVQLCVRSEFGLRAVREDVRVTGVRVNDLAPGDVRFARGW